MLWTNVNCEHMEHRDELYIKFQKVIDCLHNDSMLLVRKQSSKYVSGPGGAEYASELHAESKAANKGWVSAGKPMFGTTLELKKIANVKFKNIVRYIKRNEQRIRADSLANKLLSNNVSEFWKDLKFITGDKNIAEIRGSIIVEFLIVPTVRGLVLALLTIIVV